MKKLDLSKAYDKANWTFIRLALMQIGMNPTRVNWLMACIESPSFDILINGSPSPFSAPQEAFAGASLWLLSCFF